MRPASQTVIKVGPGNAVQGMGTGTESVDLLTLAGASVGSVTIEVKGHINDQRQLKLLPGGDANKIEERKNVLFLAEGFGPGTTSADFLWWVREVKHRIFDIGAVNYCPLYFLKKK